MIFLLNFTVESNFPFKYFFFTFSKTIIFQENATRNARIMLTTFALLKCSKKCQQNVQKPISSIFYSHFMQSRIVKLPFPAVLFRAGRLDPILIRSRFRRSFVFPRPLEYTKTAFLKNSTLDGVFKKLRRIRVDGSRIRNEKVHF